MKLIVVGIAVIALGAGVVYMKSGSDLGVTITDNEVLVATKDIDARFSRISTISDTYMIFGGTTGDHHNALTRITIAGLGLDDAKRIHKRHPDFYRCASPGARSAQRAIVQLDMVVEKSDVLDGLRRSLAEFKANLQNGGDRACVRVQGDQLKLEEAIVRENGEDMAPQIPKQNYIFIRSMETVVAKSVLSES